MHSQSHATPLTLPPAIVIDASTRWLSDVDDMALGCECADPSLQIEQWQQECAAASAQHS